MTSSAVERLVNGVESTEWSVSSEGRRLRHDQAGCPVVRIDQSAHASVTREDAHDPLKHARTDVLDIAYLEVGPSSGRPVVLLHGYPYDIHSMSTSRPDSRGWAIGCWFRT